MEVFGLSLLEDRLYRIDGWLSFCQQCGTPISGVKANRPQFGIGGFRLSIC
jgi:hypothetical protein